jgi:hypothetical protein
MSANPYRAGGRVTVDWTIIALSLFAVGLLLATTIRTDHVRLGAAADSLGGLRVLTAEERLVSFEDFSFGTHGWTVTSAEPASVTIASVLGPFQSGTLARTYALPAETRRAILTLDFYLSDRRVAGALAVDIDGARVLDGLSPGRTETATGIVAEFTPPEPRGPDNPWRLRIEVPQPGRTLGVEVQGADATTGAFGLDTVWIVAENAVPPP